MEVFEKIKELIASKRWEYDFPLTRETTLQGDLKIWGDDAFEFIEAFGREFNVDLTKFEFGKYFKAEGDWILTSIFGFILGKKKQTYVPITLGDLEKAAIEGKLE